MHPSCKGGGCSEVGAVNCKEAVRDTKLTQSFFLFLSHGEKKPSSCMDSC